MSTNLYNHKPRTARDIEILRISAKLKGEDFDESVKEAGEAALAWAENKVGRALPSVVREFREFMSPNYDIITAKIGSENWNLWALRVEDADKEIPERSWSTEIVIGGNVGEQPQISLRLVVSTKEPEFSQYSIEPSVPRLVSQMVAAPGLVKCARELSSEPLLIRTKSECEKLCDYLEDPKRQLPVFVAASDKIDPLPLIDVNLLAKATAGLACTYNLPAAFAWNLTDRYGKRLSVYDCGVRAYMPGFSDTDDEFKHRLFTRKFLLNGDGAKSCVRSLRFLAVECSISQNRLGEDVLDFESVRFASVRAKRHQLELDKRILKEQLELANDQIKEKDKEICYYVSEGEASENRAQTAEHENWSLRYQIRQLSMARAKCGETPTSEEQFPKSWSAFTDWLDRAYPDKIVLTPLARRLVRSPEFKDVMIVARCIDWLATVQHKRRLKGGGSLREETIDNGIWNSPCGNDTYSTKWQGRRYDVKWHIKTGGNTRHPERCLRIYYFWEPDRELTVIDHLPAHRKSEIT